MKRAAVLVALLSLVAACSGGSDQKVLVSAASSLSDAFADLEEAFEDANPGTDVVLNLAGSSLLREQILAGAPVDVFASASLSIMDEVESAGALSQPPTTFAFNRIEIAVPPGNPARVSDLADFARTDLYLGLCSEPVPCGSLALDALASAGVTPAIDTNEPNVRSLLTKIEEGELDAGIVYLTDVISGEVDGIAIPPEYLTMAEYPIAVIADSPNAVGAAAFIGFVQSPQGQSILSLHGFVNP